VTVQKLIKYLNLF